MQTKIQLDHPAGKKAVTMEAGKYSLMTKAILARLAKDARKNSRRIGRPLHTILPNSEQTDHQPETFDYNRGEIEIEIQRDEDQCRPDRVEKGIDQLITPDAFDLQQNISKNNYGDAE
jgi:hypothetical protein